MDDSWDGKISNMKISDGAYPELHRELSKVKHRERADRLRCLALIGLLSLGRQLLGESNKEIEKEGNLVDSEKIIKKRDSLKNKLLCSV